MAFTIIDIETTGLSRHNDKITEIAAAKVRDGKVVDTFHSLVNPEVPIPSFITKLTGITDSMVADAPTISSVVRDFHSFVGDDVFVAHNASFDFGFLSHNLEMHHGVVLSNEKLCTRKLANRLIPDLPRKRLGDLCEHFGVTNLDAHRAMGDVEATVHVFHNMLSFLEEKGVFCPRKIKEIEMMPKAKVLKLFE